MNRFLRIPGKMQIVGGMRRRRGVDLLFSILIFRSHIARSIACTYKVEVDFLEAIIRVILVLFIPVTPF